MLLAVAVIAGWLGGMRSDFLRPLVPPYFLLFVLVALVCFVAYHRGRIQAFWLGFAIVFGMHAVAIILFRSFGARGFGLIGPEWWAEQFFRSLFARVPLDLDVASEESLFWLSLLMFVTVLGASGGLVSAAIYSFIHRKE